MRKSKFMKALLVFGMSAITATSIVGMAACTDNSSDDKKPDGDDKDTCQHQFDGAYNNYMANTDQHWHFCIVCEKEFDRAAHTDGNSDGKCDTCGYEVAHSFDTSKWESDASGHWYKPTCSHTTEKGQFAAHVDEDATPNECDVCGYVGSTSAGYQAFVQDHVTAEATKVIDNTFFVAKALPLFDKWGAGVGLYASHDGTGAYPENKVDVSGGKAQLVTPAKEPATYLYLDWGNVSGSVVEGFFKISNVSGSNGYTAVQFTTSDGTKDSELFGIRTNKGGSLKYRLNGGSEVAVDGAQTWASGAGDEGSIEVYYKYDTATNKITVTIGEKAFVTDLQLTGNTLKGIKFSSGSGNADAYAIDDIIVVTNPADLGAFKTTLTANVTAANEKVTTAGFDLSSDTTFSAAAQKFTTDLEAATTAAECNEAYDTYYAALLSAYGDAVKNKINADYPATDYDDEKNEDAAAYTDAVAKLNTDVAAANTVEKVTTAYTTAKTTISALGNDELWSKEDITVTVVNGKSGANTITVKEGVAISKAELDKLVEVPSGKKVAGYYTDSECTDANEVTLPLVASSTTNQVYAKLVDKVTTTYTLNISGVSGTAYTTETLINDIFYVNNKVKSENGNKMAVVNGTATYAKQVSLTGGMAATTQNSIKFTVTGETTVTVVLGAKSDKTTVKLSVLDADGVAVTLNNVTRNGAESGLEYLPAATATTVMPDTYTFTLAAGTYYLGGSGGGAYLYSLVLEVEA